MPQCHLIKRLCKTQRVVLSNSANVNLTWRTMTMLNVSVGSTRGNECAKFSEQYSNGGKHTLEVEAITIRVRRTKLHVAVLYVRLVRAQGTHRLSPQKKNVRTVLDKT